jgi:hypothetical protein
MGHPGAPNHDHHRSIWFGHGKVLGIDFWGDTPGPAIRQKSWLSYQDGEDEAVMGALLSWSDGHDPAELLEQELVAAVRPGENGETFVELQSTFRPRSESLEFGQTNFGFLAVRVAKSISAHFGGGELTNSEGGRGEPIVFGKRARWMDYSGPVESPGDRTAEAIAGITYFDHPQNPGYPTHWHVREDGWMGASACFSAPLITTRRQRLVLRYLLHAHAGDISRDTADQIAKSFAERGSFEVAKAQVKHQAFIIRRKA